MIKDKLNYIIGGAFFALLIGVFIFFSNPRNTQRVQAGFLGLIAPFLKQRLMPAKNTAVCVKV